MTLLTYHPDTDTLDVDFRGASGPTTDTQAEAVTAAREEVQEPDDESVEVETAEADPAGQTLAHYRGGRLEEMTIEHASRRAPADWNIESLRREAAKVGATTGRVVESVTYDLLRGRTSFQTGEPGPQSPYTSDDAVRDYNQMIDEIEATSAVA